MTDRPLDSVNPTEKLDLDNQLSLVPRIKLLLTIHRSDKSVAPVDEWKLKHALLNYLKSNHSITIPEDDVNDAFIIKRYKDIKKRKRDDPVARGSICIRNLGFLVKILGLGKSNDEVETDVKVVERKFLEWRRKFVGDMDGMELNLEGVKFKLSVELPASDDFEAMRKEWEEMSAFGVKGYARDIKYQPDTIVLRGMPSRWFAEPRVSSKPSMLVSHTIFSVFGRIRNLHVAEDDDSSKDVDGEEEDLVSGLNCKILVRFDKHTDFHNALKVLCGRSLHKQGSRLRVDYDVSWDKNGFFRNARSHTEDNSRWTPAISGRAHEGDATRHYSHTSRFSSESTRLKRFKE